MILIKIIVPSARLAFASIVLDSSDFIYDVEALEEKNQDAESKWLTYQRQISKAYNKRVRL